MTDHVTEELRQVSTSYPADNLRQTYYLLLDPREREELADRLTRFVRPLRMVCQHLTEDETARLLYETLSECLCYDDSPLSEGDGFLRFTYAGGIATGRAVCMGIAELYTLLGTALGLRVETVIGYGGDPARKGGLHAWNILWLQDGDTVSPYHMDLTWDLAAYAKVRGFRYYLKSDAYMERHDHQWLKDRYPRCPRSRSVFRIPVIPAAARDRLCEEFKKMRRIPALHE